MDLRLSRELGSFYALMIINMVIGAVAMAMSISYSIQGILAMVNAIPNIGVLLSVPLIIISFAVFGIAIRWLLSSVEIFSDVQQIRREYGKKELGEGNAITMAIMRTMAFYREQKPLFKRMMWVSRIAGILLLGLAIYGLFYLLAYPPAAPSEVIVSAASIAINLSLGSLAIYIPHLFSKLASSWGYRLEYEKQVDEELKHLLED